MLRGTTYDKFYGCIQKVSRMYNLTEERVFEMVRPSIAQIPELYYVIYNIKLLVKGKPKTIEGHYFMDRMQLMLHKLNITGFTEETRFPLGMKEIFLNDNNFTNLDTLRYLPQNLDSIYLHGNNITNLSGESGTFQFLDGWEYIGLQNNLITTVPRWAWARWAWARWDDGTLHLQGNPIEITPELEAYRNEHRRLRYNARQEGPRTVYTDTQNVHDIEIQSSSRDSINRLDKYPRKLTKSNIPPEFISHLNNEQHSYFKKSELEVLLLVENAIANKYNPGSDVYENLYNRIHQELKAGKPVCSTGKIVRIVNSLSGFDEFLEDVKIQINVKSQLNALLALHRNKKTSPAEVRKDLTDRGFCDDIINEYLSYYSISP